MQTIQTFHDKLKEKIDSYVDRIYLACRSFPKDEMFGAVNQLKRAALSISLNYTEGYARRSSASNRHFLEISYGSLKESICIVEFAMRQGWINTEVSQELQKQSNEIGAMLWSTIVKKKQT